MEGSPNFRQPADKKIIIDDLASYEEEIGVGREIRRRGGFGEFLKNVFVGLILIGIVVGSFWVSFLIGKRVLVPVKNLETRETPNLVEEKIPVEEEDLSVLATPEKTAKPAEKATPVPSKRIETVKTTVASPEKMMYYKVQAGLFTTKADADALVGSLKEKGVKAFVRKVSGSEYRVQVGAYRTRSSAQVLVNDLQSKGVEATIIYE